MTAASWAFAPTPGGSPLCVAHLGARAEWSSPTPTCFSRVGWGGALFSGGAWGVGGVWEPWSRGGRAGVSGPLCVLGGVFWPRSVSESGQLRQVVAGPFPRFEGGLPPLAAASPYFRACRVLPCGWAPCCRVFGQPPFFLFSLRRASQGRRVSPAFSPPPGWLARPQARAWGCGAWHPGKSFVAGRVRADRASRRFRLFAGSERWTDRTARDRIEKKRTGTRT